MCGIFGYIGPKAINLRKATRIIEHRGPDAEGFLHFYPRSGKIVRDKPEPVEEDPTKVLFGFRRLAIIDLHAQSNQPFSDPTERYHIIFNGEIYNYLELRTTLQNEGCTFRTASDTEVLLQAYIKWGKDCLHKLNGMWAFSILDTQEKKVFCSRDRFGIKPFFYHFSKEKGFYFASEMKQFFEVGVEKQLNENLIKDFIDHSILDHSAETFYQNIFHLPAAHYLELDIENSSRFQIKRYWDLEQSAENYGNDFEEAAIAFKSLFYDSVQLRFRSDVPVGSCLSGGLDSSSIVAAASNSFDFPIYTFTSRFDLAQFDESNYVQILAEKYANIQTSFCQLNEQLFIDEIDKVIFHQDEPFPSMSILAQWEVMKLAKQKGVTVLLDGQGGDEQLAGYRKFYAFYLKEKFVKRQLVRLFQESAYLVKNREFNFFDINGIKRYLNWNTKREDFYSEKGKALSANSIFGWNSATTMSERARLDIEKFSFPPLLRYEDRNSMAFSIETRVPFMDFRLVEFLHALPSDFKIKKGYTKAVLREGLKGVLPEEIRLRISKLGFSTPQEVWMKTTLKDYFLHYFKKMDNPYFNTEKIQQLIDQNYPQHTFLLFRIFCFDRWYQMNFN